MEKVFYLTKESFDRLQKEYQELKKMRQLKLSGREETPEVLQSEDLNPDFVSFMEDLGRLEVRLAEIESVLKSAKTIKIPPKNLRGIIGVGATVTVETGKFKNNLTLVESIEADPSTGRVSIESPVGKALIGSKEGDEVVINSPQKTIYRIKKIDYRLS